MKVVTNARELPSACAFVPTMGALHAGHASLFQLAKKYSENVVASIFINPLQFESQEDLAKYPRTPDIDIEIAATAGVTHLWLPNQSEIYPEGFAKQSAGPIGDIYEGKSRPGHFDGVLTVVRRLFDLVNPTVAIFGEKDFQQLHLIKAIAGEVEIITAPTVRENDGLAMSSRNVRLTPEGRTAATVIYRALTQAKTEEELRAILATEPAFTVDYADFIDEQSFTHAQSSSSDLRAIVAGWINGVRLIDNMPMGIRA
ncbi:pantoate--beta-alanine ligase [Candidatus Planktophila sulfonica]|uniref:Pantothenate synthetase n=1 Tax=Candidatus Planktophila sulfonica TaxID=1884904 RepID=A0A249KI05_9ACTN|nr:pantoate--beta-alanine ligase [Candidatus Planktophila sulfonica]ASY16448.1 pantoate--beta-alanine ligase [Candidatus Planktophila sulfonica]